MRQDAKFAKNDKKSEPRITRISLMKKKRPTTKDHEEKQQAVLSGPSWPFVGDSFLFFNPCHPWLAFFLLSFLANLAGAVPWRSWRMLLSRRSICNPLLPRSCLCHGIDAAMTTALQFDPGVPVHRFAREAMGTTFEVIALGGDTGHASRAAEAAFDEVARLEAELSRFVPTSDTARLSAADAGEAVHVGPDAWAVLEIARRMWNVTGGAFDPTLGAGMGALQTAGRPGVVVKASAYVTVDLGGIGKGYAVDRMAELLADWGVAPAIAHGGASTARVVGTPPGRDDWPIAVRDPGDPETALGTLAVPHGAVAGSGVAIHGRHIVDPRKRGQAAFSADVPEAAAGRPATCPAGDAPGGERKSSLSPFPHVAAWSWADTAAEADALSTALMVLSAREAEGICGPADGWSGMLQVDGGLVPLGKWAKHFMPADGV